MKLIVLVSERGKLFLKQKQNKKTNAKSYCKYSPDGRCVHEFTCRPREASEAVSL